jgi:hypothetical protein
MQDTAAFRGPDSESDQAGPPGSGIPAKQEDAGRFLLGGQGACRQSTSRDAPPGASGFRLRGLPGAVQYLHAAAAGPLLPDLHEQNHHMTGTAYSPY